MNVRLLKLLGGVLLAIVAGFVTVPIADLIGGVDKGAPPVAADLSKASASSSAPKNEPGGLEIREDGAIAQNDEPDESFMGVEAVDQDDNAWGTDTGDALVERDVDSYMVADTPPAELKPLKEEEIAEDPAQQVVPGVCDPARNSALLHKGKKLANAYEKLEKKGKGSTGYTSEDYPADMWKKPDVIYKDICDRLMSKIPTGSDDEIYAFLEEPANRLDLARLTMIRKAGLEGIRRVASQKMGGTLLFHLSSDLDWMTGLMFSGPTDNMEKGLSYMAVIYSRYSEDMATAIARRVATSTAIEFAREGWSEKDMLERFGYYFGSYQAGKLNVIFDTLQYWETRIVTGCTEPGGWGSPRSLAWQRDNVRLPAEGYLGASGQLVYRLRNVAGDSVFSRDYLLPILKYTNNTTAWAHREIGGVCGACSHYGAYGALAAGIPAMTMGEPGHCAYTVRVGNDWRKGYSIYWQHSMHKVFWGMRDWDFLILMQDLYSDRYATLASDHLLALAEFYASRKMMKNAFNCYDGAVMAQPLNWPAWISYASYLKQKDASNKGKWKEMHDRVVAKMAVKFHNVAASLLSRYIYPNLLPLTPDRKERNKMFAAFFKQCDGFGTNRWDITPLLNAQIAGCTSSAEQIAYMKDSLRMLMSKQDYAGAVLTWGLDYMAGLPGTDAENAKLQEEFSDLIVSAMSRARTTKKEVDATWAALGEAIYAAASNGDKRTFQAIGKLAMRKCKKKFPKNKFKFRAFPGRVVSSKGIIRTASTLDPGQMPQCCLHWAVLQKTGGLIPAKFEGKSGITVELEDTCLVNGMVILFNGPVKNNRPFHIESSEDGQNWSSTRARIEVSGAIIRADLRQQKTCARFVRLLREGDKWDTGAVVGFYVYGKPLKADKSDKKK